MQGRGNNLGMINTEQSHYRLSANSHHLPEIAECEKCPYVNKCKSGEKCVIDASTHRDRTAYYQKNKEKIRSRKLAEKGI